MGKGCSNEKRRNPEKNVYEQIVAFLLFK